MFMDILEIITDDKEKAIYQKHASNPFPFDIIAFGKDLGLELRESKELNDQISGFIKKDDKKIYICVNSNHHIHRKRFTIAHEIGHYFLHKDNLQYGLVDNILQRKDGIINKQETEANDFAANLLMPEYHFKTLWDNKDYSISEISSMFFVSESAVLTRAKFLNLIFGYNSYYI